MKATRMVWGGLTGRTGFEAIKAAQDMVDVDIVMGLSRRDMSGIININGEKFEGVNWAKYETGMSGLYGLIELTKQAEIDAIVDFSHPDVFDKVLELAIRTGKPLISGTSGLSDRQMTSLYDATNRIPIFRGGNFRFKVKKFIDEVVAAVCEHEGRIDLYEAFYKGKSLPSETSAVLKKRVLDVTNRVVQVHSTDSYAAGNLICDWEVQIRQQISPTEIDQHKVHCRTIGFDELAHDVLEIAKVMTRKPVRPGKFYDLNEIWDDLMS